MKVKISISHNSVNMHDHNFKVVTKLGLLMAVFCCAVITIARGHVAVSTKYIVHNLDDNSSGKVVKLTQQTENKGCMP